MLARKIKEQRYTYEDYLTWGDDERWEIINGIAYNMSPAPNTSHQSVVVNFAYLLKSNLLGKKCRSFVSPIDVVLSEDNVVQPDVIIVCDPKKITKQNIQGAPDIVFEILSPSTSLKDKTIKKDLYEKYGVKEYILVNPSERYVEHSILENGKYSLPLVSGPDQKLVLKTLKITIPLKDVFDFEETSNVLHFPPVKRK